MSWERLAAALLRILIVIVVGLSVLAGTAIAEGPIDLDPDEELSGEGTEADPYTIANVSELQAVSGNMSANYLLTEDIDASETSAWNDGDGFDPLRGTDQEWFTGTFDGGGHTIEGLFIDRSSENYVGLFGHIGSDGEVTNVGIEKSDVTGDLFVGALGGMNSGNVSEAYATGDVHGTERVGGLIGREAGNVSKSSASVDVHGTEMVGGLAGRNGLGTVNESYATGEVAGEYRVGGLLGQNIGAEVDESYATGDTTGNNVVGGLVGENYGEVSESNASSDVEGAEYVGGLVGHNPGTVNESCATGSVNGTERVGGLVGQTSRLASSKVYRSCATGSVDGTERIGGLVGQNDAVVRESYATGDVNGSERVGGLVGFTAIRSIVNESYATGHVEGNERVGGLVGDSQGSGTNVENSAWDEDTTNQGEAIGRGSGSNVTAFGDTGNTDPASETDDGIPGFGLAATPLAIALAGLLAARCDR